MTTVDEGTTPTVRASKSEVTRARIISAAAQVLASRGYKHVRLSAIAAEAGMQTASLYYYFDSKEDLVEKALGEAATQVHSAVYSAVEDLPESATPGERLLAALRAFIVVRLDVGNMSAAHIRNYRDLPADIRDRLHPALEQFASFWDTTVRAAVESGDVRADIDPRTLHMFVFHTSEQIAKWPESARRSTTETADVMLRLIHTGLIGPA